MKKILVIHNPTAGDADQSKTELLSRLEHKERKISYISTQDEGWEDFSLDKEDIIVLSGGDGTVHKFVKTLLKRNKKERKIPIYLVPSGTANNIATTLKLKSPRDFYIEQNLKNYQLFDYGKISGLSEQNFFLEGIGFGFFPELIRQMKDADDLPDETGEEKIERSLKVCREIVMHMKPQKIKIKANGEKIKDKFLLAEVLNIRQIGPNLQLAPLANPGDGLMDLILITPENRKLLLEYIDNLITGKAMKLDINKFVKARKVKKIKMKGKVSIMHVDDEILTGEEKYTFKIKVKQGVLRFL